MSQAENGRVTRGITNGKLISTGFSNNYKDFFISDAIKIWNTAPDNTKKHYSWQRKKSEIFANCYQSNRFNLTVSTILFSFIKV